MPRVLEFIDYIFDRYAYLGVEPTASTETLRREITRRRAENHPDKLLRVSDAIRETAARDMELANDCARVLLDDAIRARYDERLAEFKQHEPQLVSTSGTPILDPTRFRIDLESLLDTNIRDYAELEAQAARLSGFDEKRLARAKTRFEKEPDDLDMREQFREQLLANLVFLSVIEDYYWQKAGVYGGTERNALSRASHSDDVLTYLNERVDAVKARIESAAVERHAVAQLGFVPLLLLGHHSAGADAADITRELAEAATQSFEVRIEELRALVERKKKVIDDLLLVPRTRQLKADTGSGVLDIMLIQTDAEMDEDWPGAEFTQMGVVMRLDTNAGTMTPVMLKATADELAAWPNALHLLEPNPELPSLFLEAVALAERLTDAEDGQ